MRKISIVVWLVLFAITSQAQIRLNQLGFLPDIPKKAIVSSSLQGASFELVTEDDEIVYSGTLKPVPGGGESVSVADFSDFRVSGTYYIRVGNVISHPFHIRDKVYEDVFKASLKYYYFSRASIDLEPEYAGIYARKGGHPDTLIYHLSGMRANPSPKGWYDAGDYNKYVVNSGISTYTLMSLYEHFPEYIRTIKLAIPESGNSTPDLLDEVFWNLSWMLTMQDPSDGAVYHKLSNIKFDEFIMPEYAIEPRYVTQKSGAATQHFVATMATASRIFKDFQEDYPKYDSIFLAAAVKAYNSGYFPREGFEHDFRNPGMMETGEYAFSQGAREWAEIEMYITTKGEKGILGELKYEYRYPEWSRIESLPLVSLAANLEKLTASEKVSVMNAFRKLGDAYYNYYTSSKYRMIHGMGGDDYIWGSNGNAANQSYIALVAYRLTNDFRYLEAALGNLDYLLGKNALEYSFVTGFGHKYPQNPHHRISEADGIEEPIPGMLVGGPWESDGIAGCGPIPRVDGLRYADLTCNYFSNEVAINWNAPFAFVTGAINAFFHGLPVIVSQPKDITFTIGGEYSLSLTLLVPSENVTIDWYKNGVLYKSAGSTELVLANARKEDEGEYYAIATNAYGSVVSKKVSFVALRSANDFLESHLIPGIVEGEDFYQYASSIYDGNRGGMYRNDHADIYATDDSSGRFHIKFAKADLAKYNIRVNKAGQYQARLRGSVPPYHTGIFSVVCKGPGNSFQISNFSFDGSRKPGWHTVTGNTWNLVKGDYTVEIQTYDTELLLNYIEFIGLWEDCAGITGGSYEQDECGACLLPDDPDFDNCLITSIPKGEEWNARIYPVPASDILYVDHTGGQRFEIWNTMGQKILSNELNADHRVDISGLNPGSYRIRLIGHDHAETFQFVKK